jgi:hypothetical protein
MRQKTTRDYKGVVSKETKYMNWWLLFWITVLGLLFLLLGVMIGGSQDIISEAGFITFKRYLLGNTFALGLCYYLIIRELLWGKK